jgi:hypothetical protein
MMWLIVIAAFLIAAVYRPLAHPLRARAYLPISVCRAEEALP